MTGKGYARSPWTTSKGLQQQLRLRRGLPVLVEHPALQAGVAAHDYKRSLGERSAETHLCRLLRLLQTL